MSETRRRSADGRAGTGRDVQGRTGTGIIKRGRRALPCSCQAIWLLIPMQNAPLLNSRWAPVWDKALEKLKKVDAEFPVFHPEFTGECREHLLRIEVVYRKWVCRLVVQIFRKKHRTHAPRFASSCDMNGQPFGGPSQPHLLNLSE